MNIILVMIIACALAYAAGYRMGVHRGKLESRLKEYRQGYREGYDRTRRDLVELLKKNDRDILSRIMEMRPDAQPGEESREIPRDRERA
jgi:hypothetical protein